MTATRFSPANDSPRYVRPRTDGAECERSRSSNESERLFAPMSVPIPISSIKGHGGGPLSRVPLCSLPSRVAKNSARSPSSHTLRRCDYGRSLSICLWRSSTEGCVDNRVDQRCCRQRAGAVTVFVKRWHATTVWISGAWVGGEGKGAEVKGAATCG